MSKQGRKLTKSEKGRRRFLQNVLKAAGGVSVLGLGVTLYGGQAQALPAWAIRPPGALAEDDFLAACLRCGLCVQDCPYDTLKLADLLDPIALGTPYFVARNTPCEMCEDIPCVVACPSGALDKALDNIDDARMGLAVIVDQENCLAYRGLRCEVCFNVCPLQGDAIKLQMQSNPRKTGHARFIPMTYADVCTGCGKCEEVCVLEEAAIKVLPQKLARGKQGAHYRLGWEEKEQAGGSLIGAEPEHRYNMPEGQQYDYDTGLSGKAAETPFSSNPLDSLKRFNKDNP